MKQEDVRRVQSSFASVTPMAPVVADMFYNRLFELDPSLRGLFDIDMDQQGTKLMKMIAIAVNGLENLQAILPVVQALGERHATYRVKDTDYATMGEALIWTLEKGLGEAFSNDDKQAWTEIYTTLASIMIEAANNKYPTTNI